MAPSEIPGNAFLAEQGSTDTVESARTYLDHLVGDAADPHRYHAYLDHGPAAVELLRRATSNRWLWARGYSDYHPDTPGGSAAGRSVESAPFDAAQLGEERARLIPPSLAAPVPMPITSPDYRWMNLMAKAPGKAMPRIVRRLAEGLGGMAVGREYVATGQALQAGIYRALLDRGATPWTCTDVAELATEDGRVTGAVLVQQGRRVTVRARRGVVGRMWIIFDQQYRNSYVFAGVAFPRIPVPKQWYEAGIAHRGDAEQLATAMGDDAATFTQSLARFNELAGRAHDEDFGRGASAYDRYYGDPTVTPSPNLRPLSGTLYAVEVVLADLGTCGGLAADHLGRVLREEGSVVEGLYAIGNAAANAFGNRYPGAGATIGQVLVFGMVAARHAAGQGAIAGVQPIHPAWERAPVLPLRE